MIPGILRPVYTVFSGENTWSEFFSGLRTLPFGGDEDSTVSRFERAFARFTGRRHGAAFGSGRMALYAILEVLEIGPGDEVILQAFTCNVVPRAILARGATPVYVDIDPVTFNMDCAGLAAALGERTRAVIVQHTFGVPPDVVGLRKALSGHRVAVIEDCAHGFRPLPTGALGDVRGFSFFSTDHTKPLNTHVGGVACCDSDTHAQRIAALAGGARRLGFFGRKRLMLSFLLEFIGHRPSLYPITRFGLSILTRLRLPFTWADHHAIAGSGRNSGLYRMTGFQAQLGLSQLERVEANMAHRCAMFQHLEGKLGWYCTGRAYPVLRYAMLVEDRDGFIRSVAGGLARSIWFDAPVSGGAAVYADVLYVAGQCPVAERVAAHVVNIAISSKVPSAAFEHIQRANAAIHRIDIAGIRSGVSK
jgi:perosamine synthetase